MCSTPRPKTQAKGKSGRSGSLLSNISAEKRRRFAERANIAQERRDDMTMKNQKSSSGLNVTLINNKVKLISKDKKVQKKPNSLSYWLVSASLKEIFIMLFFGKSMHI
jgi:hypothetical protein